MPTGKGMVNGNWTFCVNIYSQGTQVVTQHLKALATLSENLLQFLGPTLWLTTMCNSSPRGFNALFLPLGTRHARGTQTYVEAKYQYTKSQ